MADRPSCPLAAVLLAAGSSSRLGRSKQLMEFNGEALVAKAVRLLRESGASPVIVVCGHQSEKVRAAISKSTNETSDVKVVINDNWSQGMGSSIARGCAEIPSESTGVLMMLCDQWRLDEQDLDQLIRAWLDDISVILCAEYKSGKGSIEGPPVVFPRSLIRELIKLTGVTGAKPVIESNRHLVKTVPLQNASVDLDTPADLDLLLSAQRM